MALTISFQGVTKIGTGKFKLNSGSTVMTNSKYTLYPRGGLSDSKYYFSFASKLHINVTSVLFRTNATFSKSKIACN